MYFFGTNLSTIIQSKHISNSLPIFEEPIKSGWLANFVNEIEAHVRRVWRY